MATSTRNLVIGDRLYWTWPDPMLRLLERGLIEIDPTRTHAQPVTFRLKPAGIYTPTELRLILDATTARSTPA